MEITTFNSAVKYIEKHIPSAKKKHPGQLGLDRMKYLLDLLGNPHLKYKTVHVGGTSGKGSTATMIAEILAQKYRVGLHTSPHLERITERIMVSLRGLKARGFFLGATVGYPTWCPKTPYRPDLIGTGTGVNGREIKNHEFIALINQIISPVKKVEKSEFGAPSYFEILLAASFLFFAQKKVDFAVIEVGMGGRFDGSNVILPEVAVITNIGLDHTEVLGNSLESIARDKVGIIKNGIQVISGVSQPKIINIIKSVCRNKNARLYLSGKDFKYYPKSSTEHGNIFHFVGYAPIKNFYLSLPGNYQMENAAIAIQTIQAIKKIAPKITVYDLRSALKKVYIPGRFEIIYKNPYIILDGAHNSDKMKALIKAVKIIFPGELVKALVAIKTGKNANKILKHLLKISKEIIITQFNLKQDLGDTFSYNPFKLEKIAKKLSNKNIRVIKNPNKALQFLKKKSQKTDIILVTGSLYLVGEIRKNLKTQMSNIKSTS